MIKLWIPLFSILLLAALVAGGIYALAQIPAAQSFAHADRHGGEDFERGGRLEEKNPPAPDGAQTTGAPPRRDGHFGEEISLLRGLSVLVKNLFLISIVIAITVLIQKAAAFFRRRKMSATV